MYSLRYEEKKADGKIGELFYRKIPCLHITRFNTSSDVDYGNKVKIVFRDYGYVDDVG